MLTPGLRYHLQLDIRENLRKPLSDLEGLFTDNETGKLLTSAQAKEYLMDQLQKGRKVLPCADCEGFDYITGCPGHKK